MNLTWSAETHPAARKAPLIYNGDSLRLSVSRRKSRTLENGFLVQNHFSIIHTYASYNYARPILKEIAKPKPPTLCLSFILEALAAVYIWSKWPNIVTYHTKSYILYIHSDKERRSLLLLSSRFFFICTQIGIFMSLVCGNYGILILHPSRGQYFSVYIRHGRLNNPSLLTQVGK